MATETKQLTVYYWRNGSSYPDYMCPGYAAELSEKLAKEDCLSVKVFAATENILYAIRAKTAEGYFDGVEIKFVDGGPGPEYDDAPYCIVDREGRMHPAPVPSNSKSVYVGSLNIMLGYKEE